MRRGAAALLLAAAGALAACKSPMTKAAAQGDVAQIQALAALGVDPSKEDGALRSPLYWATYENHPAAAAALLKAGASLDREAVDAAIRLNRLEVLRVLARAGPFPDDLLEEARHAGGQLRLIAESSLQSPASAAPAVEAAAAQPAAPAPLVSDVDQPTEKGAPRPHDFALIVGIQDYQSLPKADFAERDAQAVRRHLEALGVPARNVVALTGSQATGTKLKSYLEEWLPRNVQSESTLFFYYSGHGAPDPSTGDAYLVPWDGDPEFLRSTALPLQRLYADLAKTKARRVVVALDACFSGAGGRSVLPKGARPLVTKIDQGPAVGKRLTVLAAASGEQITGALDDQGHGLFTYYFLKGLEKREPSAKALFDYLQPKVEDEARRQNREQTPVLLGQDAPL